MKTCRRCSGLRAKKYSRNRPWILDQERWFGLGAHRGRRVPERPSRSAGGLQMIITRVRRGKKQCSPNAEEMREKCKIYTSGRSDGRFECGSRFFFSRRCACYSRRPESGCTATGRRRPRPVQAASLTQGCIRLALDSACGSVASEDLSTALNLG